MEGPTATRRVASPTRSGTFPSARMLEAQRMFQSVVKHELQLLLESGTKREEAVKLLLRRIVASTEPPDAAAVRGVMRQFQMNHDDAVRALIVKQELGRLKRQGLDSFAAIEELTRKMKSREGKEEEKDVTQTRVLHDEAIEAKETKSIDAMPAAEMASPTAEKDGNETSLSLIQRINQVSISSNTTLEREHEERDDEPEKSEDTDGEEHDGAKENTTLCKSPLRVQSPHPSHRTDLTPPSRKRRATVESPRETVPSNNTRSVKPMFPDLKKQKVCAKVGDGFLQVVSRKSKQTSLSLSKNTATLASSGSSPRGGGATRGDHKTKVLHKRQRMSSTGMQDEDESPIADELCVSHVHHRHHGHHVSKRQKSSSTH